MENQNTAAPVEVFFDDEHIEFTETAASATKTALDEIDGELQSVTTALESLRSREALLKAAREEVLQRSRAAEAIEDCLKEIFAAINAELEEDEEVCSPLVDKIGGQLEAQLNGILSVAARVGA